jgi:hypothetical protein
MAVVVVSLLLFGDAEVDDLTVSGRGSEMKRSWPIMSTDLLLARERESYMKYKV